VLFETVAFLSTVSLIVIFVVLWQVDRASRRDDNNTANE
jgi:hypothetical protein